MQIFETSRLRVRAWSESDFDHLFALLSDPVTMAHWPAPLDEPAARAWLQRALDGMQRHGYGRWCCERKEDAAVIGDIGIVRTLLQGEWVNDLGYIVDHRYWRQGYALEAARGAITWAGSHGLDCLVANMATDNAPSIALAEKLGMSRKREFNKASNAGKATYWYELELDAP